MNISFKRNIASYILLGLVIVLLILGISLNPKFNTNQFPFYWDSIDVVIDVQDNGDMLVSETQKYVFNIDYSEIRYRYIPLDKIDRIVDVNVLEKNQVLPSQVEIKNNQLWIKWQHELNPPESRTFEIKYRVVGGLHVNTNDSQVYWEAIFDDRYSPIKNAKVTVKLPQLLAGKITSYTYYPSVTPVSSQKIDDRTIEFIAQEPILKGKLLEVQVSFPNDILNLPQSEWQKRQISTIERSKIEKFLFDNLFFILVYGLTAILTVIPALYRILTGNSGSRSRVYGGDGGSGGGSGGGGGGGGSGGDGGGGGGGG